ncbi:MAG: hypothetical protein WC829_01490 [Hyphomicrobium sp.]|jgi:hypothetical protein
MKRPITEQIPDHNFPGLKVCTHGCADELDPYRLPARQTERITLRFPRPDANIDANPNAIQTTGQDQWTISPEQNTATPENNGNLDDLSTATGN